MATYTGIQKIKIGDNVFELAIDWSNVANKPTIPINTDEKVSTAHITNGTTYYPVLGSNTTSAATKFYDSYSFRYKRTTSSSSKGDALLILGYDTSGVSSITANDTKGVLRLYGTGDFYTDLVSGKPTANRTITLPNATGTLALNTAATTSANGLMSAADKTYVSRATSAVSFTTSSMTLNTGYSHYLNLSTSDTTDNALLTAITNLGWDSEVITS